MWQYNHQLSLYHSGVLGMRWGVRKNNYTYIGFPRSEITSLKKRLDSGLPIYTTRVSSEMGKYKKDNVYNNQDLGKLKVISITSIKHISEHPFIKELNRAQINTLSRYGVMELIKLEREKP